MTYGWLDIGNHGTQQDGFFISEKNEILYWRNKSARGHLISYETANQIRAYHRRTSRMATTYTLCALLAAAAAAFILPGDIYLQLSELFSRKMLRILIALVILLAPVLVFLLAKPTLDKLEAQRIATILGESPYLDMVRPEPQVLVEGGKLGRAPFVIIALISAGCFAWAFLASGLVGDRAVIGIAGIIILIFGGWLFRLPKGDIVSRHEIRFYDEEAGGGT